MVGKWENYHPSGALLLLHFFLFLTLSGSAQNSSCRVWASIEPTSETQLRVPSTANQLNSSVFESSWSKLSGAFFDDNDFVVNQLPPFRKSTILNLSNFGFRIPQGATIERIRVYVEGKARDGEGVVRSRVANLENPNTGHLSKDIVYTERPLYSAWSNNEDSLTTEWVYTLYDGSAWSANELNDPDFGFNLQVRNILRDSISIDLDAVSIEVDYLPAYSICDHPCATFYVDEEPNNPPNYHWMIPQGFRRLSGSYDKHIIDVEATTALSGTHTICVEKVYLDGQTSLCCRNILVENCAPTSIGDFVFFDMNGDGIQGSDDLGIPNFPIRLRDENGALAGSTVTDSDGNFLFDNLIGGTYHLELDVPNQMIPTKVLLLPKETNSILDETNGVGTSASVFLKQGEINNNADIGFTRPISLGDFVWEDVNGNGLQDTLEPGIEGVEVFVFDSNDVLVDNATTNLDGLYLFEGLLPDSYTLQFVKADTLLPTIQNAGNDDNIDSDVDESDKLVVLDPGMGNVDLSNDVGYSRIGSIGDFVFNDRMINNIQDAEDLPLAGIQLFLFSNGVLLDSTISDNNGYYLFDSLRAAMYEIEVLVPDTFVIIESGIGQDSLLDSDLELVNGRYITEVFLFSGENRTDVDFGLRDLPALSGRVFEDLNFDGVRDDNESDFLPIVDVHLFDTGGNLFKSTTTNTKGEYVFRGFSLGDYYVVFSGIEDFGFGPSLIGDPNLDSDVTQSNGRGSTDIIRVDEFKVYENIDAGISPYGSIGDFVFEDLFNDGAQDAEDQGVPGIELYLFQDGLALDTTISDADGAYNFSNVLRGNYTIESNLPDGLVIAKGNVGDDNLDSDWIIGTPRPQSVIITLEPDQDLDNVDFGFAAEPSAIGGTVWLDTLYNGNRDAFEDSQSNIIVMLKDLDGNILSIFNTGQDGNYLFSEVFNGNYYLTFGLVPNSNFTLANLGSEDLDSDVTSFFEFGSTDTIKLVSGVDQLNIDAGITVYSTIGDFVWEDLNVNGIQDIGEPGLPGVEVQLLDSQNQEVESTISDVSGHYFIDSIFPGEYQLQIELAPGFHITSTNQGDDALDNDADETGNILFTALGEGGVNDRLDIGLTKEASVGDFVFNDLNANGMQDASDEGLAGVTVSLLKDGVVVSSTTTNESGFYQFTDLEAGEYTISTDIPMNFEIVLDDPNVSDDINSDFINSGQDARTEMFLLSSGENNIDIDLGFAMIPAIVSGKVWNDISFDGQFQTSEDVVTGTQVELYNSSGILMQSTNTESNGAYSFDKVFAGDYYVVFDLLDNYSFTLANQGANTTDSDVTSSLRLGSTDVFTLAAGVDQTDIDAGMLMYTEIGDFVWEDINADGIQDGNEPGIGGVSIDLLDANGALVESTISDNTGLYLIDSLLPGAYTLKFNTTGFDITLQDIGNDLLDNDANELGELPIVVDGNGGANSSYDIGLTRRGTIGDLVFDDILRNDQQDASDLGISGVQLYLISNGERVDSTVSMTNGAYAFTNVPAGYYSIQAITPFDFEVVLESIGVNDELDSDLISLGDVTETGTFLLTSGDDLTSVDLGFAMVPTKISGQVWNDVSYDGQFQSDENLIEDLQVELYSSNNVLLQSTITSSLGTYEFDSVFAGDYYVVFDLLDNYSFTLANQGANTTDSDVTSSLRLGSTDVFTLAAGVDQTDIDAGMLMYTEIGDFVWEDINADGIQDGNEPGIGGVSIDLLDANGALVESTVSDNTGLYLIDSLLPGVYILKFNTTGFDITLQDIGNDLLDNDANELGELPIVVDGNGGANSSYDIGLTRRGNIGDFVFDDILRNDQQDASDLGISGVQLYLISNGERVDSAVSMTNGAYAFINVPAGYYSIQAITPLDFEVVLESIGVNDELDSDLLSLGDVTETGTFLLTSGDDLTSVDLGFAMVPTKISGQVWNDVSYDGQFQSDENLIEDLQVELYSSNNVLLQSTITSSLGNYEFDSVFAGDYYVVFDLLDNYSFTLANQGANTTDSDVTSSLRLGSTDVFTLAAGVDQIDIDAGMLMYTEIGDFVWEDINADGIQDVNEPGIGGVSIDLLDANGVVVESTVSDNTGLYLIDSLLPGSYTLKFNTTGFDITLQDIGNDLLDNDANELGELPIVVDGNGGANSSYDIGLTRRGTIGDFVFDDILRNDQQDASDLGISGVQLYLISNGERVDSTVSMTNGAYAFTNVPAGSYSVEVLTPMNFEGVLKATGLSDDIDSDLVSIGDIAKSGGFLLSSGENITSLDFGFAMIPTQLTGQVWNDVSYDGQFQVDENLLEGIQVELFSANNVLVQRVSTNSNGGYVFDNIFAGDYYIVFDLLNNYAFTKAKQGSITTDSDVTGNQGSGSTDIFTVTAGLSQDNIDAGMLMYMEIGDFVWEDLNADGIQDGNEGGLEGVQVDVLNDLGVIVESQVTDLTGLYLVDSLLPGGYTIRATITGFEVTFQDVGHDLLDSDANEQGEIYITIDGNGGTNSSYDIGLTRRGTIGDFVFNDFDNDGIQDISESGIENVRVHLVSNGSRIETTTSDANGNYLFTDISAGLYTIEVETPAEFSAVLKNGSTTDDIDSDFISGGVTATTVEFLLPSGRDNLDVDLGFTMIPASISGLTFLDQDFDGQFTSADIILSGIDGTIYRADNSIAATFTTGNDGIYQVDGLFSGDYYVVFTPEEGRGYTKSNIGIELTDNDVTSQIVSGSTDVFTLLAGVDQFGQNGGYVDLASVGDYVFIDENRDGIQDVDDNPAQDIQVNLINTTGDTIAATISDENGFYTFQNVYPGDYYIGFDIQLPFISTSTGQGTAETDSDVTDLNGNNTTSIFSLAPTDSRTDIDAGLAPLPASISGVVWEDEDRDGLLTPTSSRVEDAKVYLLVGSNVIDSILTDDTGRYSFNGLNAGSYAIQFPELAGFISTLKDVGIDENIDSDIDDNFLIDNIDLAVGQSANGNNAGYFDARGMISGLVWIDDNVDGIRQNTETDRVEAVPVALVSSLGQVVQMVMTNVEGEYTFVDVVQGDYTVRFSDQSLYGYSPADQGGDDAIDSDVIDFIEGSTTIITVEDLGDILNVDAGYSLLSSVGDFVWNDIDNDGIQGVNDLGMGGIKLYLLQNGVKVDSMVSSNDGFYTFGQLFAGTYTIQVENNPNLNLALVNTAADPTLDSDLREIAGVITTESFLLLPGENREDIDLGFRNPPSSISGIVWEDSNYNGQLDANENRLGGIDGSLFTASGNLAANFTTSADGTYTVQNIFNGDYYLEFTPSIEYTFTLADIGAESTDSDVTGDNGIGTTAVITIPAGTDTTGINAGLYQLTTVGDYVWNDINGNGIQDANESGIEGLILHLLDNSGQIVQSTTTDVDGLYSFIALSVGDYTIRLDIPSMFDVTIKDAGSDDIDNDAEANGEITFSATATGGSNSTFDIGLISYASVGDFVWQDLNFDGLQSAADPGLADVKIYLVQSGIRIDSTTSEVGGGYTFLNLIPGDYSIQVLVPSAFVTTLEPTMANKVLDSDLAPGQSNLAITEIFSLSEGETNEDVDLGFALKPSIVSGIVWEDTVFDGQYDSNNESGIGNVEGTLFTSTGSVVKTFTTNASGNYSLINVFPGDYYIVFDTPNTYENTLANVGNDDTDSDVDDIITAGATSIFTVGTNNNLMNVFAGYVRRGSIGDFVWVDENRDGIQNNGELGINGIEVTLYDQLGNNLATMITMNDPISGLEGYYTFDNLFPGDYYIGFDIASPYEATIPEVGNSEDDSNVNNANGLNTTSIIALTSGETKEDVDAGLSPIFATISGIAWIDENEDGLLDPTEQGEEGIVVRLILQGPIPITIKTTSTLSDGTYTFDEVEMGTYGIQFIIPGGKLVTIQDVGSNELIDSDINDLGLITGVNANFGDDLLGYNAGLINDGGSICGTVWVDEMNNDSLDITDLFGVEAVKVRLLDTNEMVFDSVLTDVDGNYTFEGIEEGLYIVQFDIPADYVLVNPNISADSTDSDVVGLFLPNSTDTIRILFQDKVNHIDAGVYQYSSIGNRVLVDVNEDGIQNTGDVGLNDVIVELLDENGFIVQSTISSSVNGVDGIYEFNDIEPGIYTIQTQAPTFYVFALSDVGGNDDVDFDIAVINGILGSTNALTLSSGTNIDNIDIGYLDRVPESTTVSGFLWDDINANGVREGAEPGENGRTVSLFSENGSLLGTRTTAFNANFNVDGYYEFLNLNPGNYYVVFDLPTDAFKTIANATVEGLDSDITDSQSINSTDVFEIGTGIVAFSTDGGFTYNGSIGNRTWFDFKMDGILEFENGVSFVDVTLKRPNGTIVATTFSDFFPMQGDGYYSFDNIPAGEYYIEFSNSDGFLYTFPNQGLDDTKDSDVTGAFGPGTTDIFLLKSGEVKNDVDAGLVRQISTLGDYVWADFNSNGLQAANEPGLNGVTVRLLSNTFGGLVIAETMTTDGPNGNGGYYQFDNIQPGLYIMEFELLSGYEFTKNVNSNQLLNSDVTDLSTGKTDEFFVLEGTTNGSIDAGLFQPSELGDFVFEDVNRNGLQDVGEPGISNVTVNLFSGSPFPVDSRVTDQDGKYCFDSLSQGLYTLEFEMPTGYEFTIQDVGMDETIDSDANSSGVTPLISLAHGVSFKNLDAGLFPTNDQVIISTVWIDSNENGIREEGEARMEGVEIQVMDGEGTMMDTLYSDRIGKFSFKNEYFQGTQVYAIAPLGYVFTTSNVGDDSHDSDVDSRGFSHLIIPNSTDTNIDVGLVPVGNLVVDVWHDITADGYKDSLDLSISGIELELFDMNGNLIDWNNTNQLTQGNSVVSFNNVGFGEYRLKVVDSKGLLASTGMSNGGAKLSSSFYENNGEIWSQPIKISRSEPYKMIGGGFYNGGTIITSVWSDDNGNGQKELFEGGKRDIYATVIESNTGLIYTKLTDNTGKAIFDRLPKGEYFVRYFSFNALEFTLADIGSDMTDSDVTNQNGIGTTKVYSIKHDFITRHICAGLKGQILSDSKDVGELTMRSTNKVEVSLYPNPTANFITISGDFLSKHDYQIFDLKGSLILKGSISAQENKIDCSLFDAGLYTVKITGSEVNDSKFFFKE